MSLKASPFLLTNNFASVNAVVEVDSGETGSSQCTLMAASAPQAYISVSKRASQCVKEDQSDSNTGGDARKHHLQAHCARYGNAGCGFTPSIRYGKLKFRSPVLSSVRDNTRRGSRSLPQNSIFNFSGNQIIENSNASFKHEGPNVGKSSDQTLIATTLSSSAVPYLSSDSFSNSLTRYKNPTCASMQPCSASSSVNNDDAMTAGCSLQAVGNQLQPKPERKPYFIKEASAAATAFLEGINLSAVTNGEVRRTLCNSNTAVASASPADTLASTDWIGLQRHLRLRTHATDLVTLDLTNATSIKSTQWRWLCSEAVPQLRALQVLRLVRMGLKDWHMRELARACCGNSFSAPSSSSSRPLRAGARNYTPEVVLRVASGSNAPLRKILPQFRVVDVSGNNLSHRSATHLGKMLLWASDTLDELRVASNPLRDYGMQILGIYLFKLSVESVRMEPHLFPVRLVDKVDAAWRNMKRTWGERIASCSTNGKNTNGPQGGTTPQLSAAMFFSDDDAPNCHPVRTNNRDPCCGCGAVEAGDQYRKTDLSVSAVAASSAQSTHCTLSKVHIGPSFLDARDCKASVRGLADLLSGASHAHRLQVLLVAHNLSSSAVSAHGVTSDSVGWRDAPTGTSFDGSPSQPLFTNFAALKSLCALTEVDLSTVPLSQACPPSGCRELFLSLFFACPRLRHLNVSGSFESALVPQKALYAAMSQSVRQRMRQDLKRQDTLAAWHLFLEEEGQVGFSLEQTSLAGQARVGDIFCELLAHVAFNAAAHVKSVPSSFSNLEKLGLDNTGLTDEGVRGLCIALRTAPHGDGRLLRRLSVLTLSRNLLTAFGCVRVLYGLLVERDTKLTILELQGNMGVMASDTQGLDAIDAAVEAALAHRTQKRLHDALATTETDPVALGDGDARGELLPLSVHYGPCGDGAAVYCAQCNVRGGCQTSCSNAGSRSPPGQRRTRGSYTSHGESWKPCEESHLFPSSRAHPCQRQPSYSDDPALAPLGHSHVANERDVPLPVHMEEGMPFPVDTRRPLQKVFSEARRSVGSVVPCPQVRTPRGSSVPRFALRREHGSSPANLSDGAGGAPGQFESPFVVSTLGGTSSPSMTQSQPRTSQQVNDLQGQPSCQLRQQTGFEPPPSTEKKNKSPMLSHSSQGADTCAVPFTDLSPLPRQVSGIVEDTLSSAKFPTYHTRQHSSLCGDMVASTDFGQGASTPGRKALSALRMTPSSDAASRAARDSVKTLTSSVQGNDSRPEKGTTRDASELFAGVAEGKMLTKEYHGKGAVIQRKLLFPHPVPDTGAGSTEDERGVGTTAFGKNIGNDEERLQLAKRREGYRSDNWPSHRRSVRRCFILSYTHPPGHLLCRAMHVLQQRNSEGTAARLAMEADMQRFLQESCGDSDGEGIGQAEDAFSSDIPCDVDVRKSRRRNTEEPTVEQVRCIAHDLMERGAIRLEITSSKRRTVVARLLHRQFSVPTLQEQEARFVELMRCLRARPPSLPAWDMVGLVSFLVARSRQPVNAVMDLYDGSPAVAVHQNHTQYDTHRLLELLCGNTRDKHEQGRDSVLDGALAVQEVMWSGFANEYSNGAQRLGSEASGVGMRSYSSDDVARNRSGIHQESRELEKKHVERAQENGPNLSILNGSMERCYRDDSCKSDWALNSGSRILQDFISVGSPLLIPLMEPSTTTDAVSFRGPQSNLRSSSLAKHGMAGPRSGGKIGHVDDTPAERGPGIPQKISSEEKLGTDGMFSFINEDFSFSPSGDLCSRQHVDRPDKSDGAEDERRATEPNAACIVPLFQASGGAVDFYKNGVSDKEGSRTVCFFANLGPGHGQLAGPERTLVISYAHTEGGALCRAWHVLHACGTQPYSLVEQARAALLSDFLGLLQPPNDDSIHIVSSVNIIFDDNTGITNMLSLRVRTNERRATIASRLQASVIRRSFPYITNGDAFSSVSSGSDAMADANVAESSRTYFPRLQHFLEENPSCDTVNLLGNFLDAPSRQDIKRRLLQSYRGLVPMIHYHHVTLSVFLKRLGVKSIEEIVKEATAVPPLPYNGMESLERTLTDLGSSSVALVLDNTNKISTGTIIAAADPSRQGMALDGAFNDDSLSDTSTAARQSSQRRRDDQAAEREAAEVTRAPLHKCSDTRKAGATEVPLQPQHFIPAGVNYANFSDTRTAADATFSAATPSRAASSLQGQEQSHPSRQASLPSGLSVTHKMEHAMPMSPMGLVKDQVAPLELTATPAVLSEPINTPQTMSRWDMLLESKRRRLMRVAYQGMSQGVIPLDPQQQQRVRVLKGRWNGQRVLLTIEWEILIVLYFERARSLGSTKRTLMLVHPVACGFTCIPDDAYTALSPREMAGPKQKETEALLGKCLVIRIKRPYSPDEVGVPRMVLEWQLQNNARLFARADKKRKELGATELEISSKVNAADSSDLQRDYLKLLQPSLLMSIDAGSRRDVAAAVKMLNDSVRRATDAIHKSMLTASVLGDPTIEQGDANALHPELAATPSTLPS